MSDLTVDKVRNYSVPTGGMSIKGQHFSTNFIVTFMLLNYDQLRDELAKSQEEVERLLNKISDAIHEKNTNLVTNILFEAVNPHQYELITRKVSNSTINFRAEKAEADSKRYLGVLKNIVSNDMRSHFNRVDAITLSQWAREALNPVDTADTKGEDLTLLGKELAAAIKHHHESYGQEPNKGDQ